MNDDYVGMIKLFAGNTAPENWAFCDGSIIQVSANDVLYAIIGTQFGGIPNVEFALPNLNGNVSIGAGQSPGLSSYTQGQTGGSATVIVSPNQLPSHNHGYYVTGNPASLSSASIGASVAAMTVPSGRSKNPVNGYVDLAPDTNLKVGSLAPSGQNQAHNNMQPYLAMNFIICVSGMVPPHQ